MVYVSVSAYNDAGLLDGCLRSVREHCPDATIAVVDGRYESFRPDAPENSTDGTATVAREHGATYDPAGPFPREVHKHRYRVAEAPAHERALFIDADERLAAVDWAALQRDRAYAVRIHNPVVYSESPIRYWPRVFRPADVDEVARWDAYSFTVPCDRTDAVTLAHRHDLRSQEYRGAKYERFERENRDGRYADSFERYLNNDYDVSTEDCPRCGEASLVRSPATNESGDFSEIVTCVRTDSCYRAVESVAVDSYEYLPDDWERGLETDPGRLRLELLDAGADFLAMHDFSMGLPPDRVGQYRPLIRLFVDETFGDRDPQVFGAND